MPIILALGRFRQKDCRESEANLGYTVSSNTAGYGVRPYLKTKQQ